MGRCGCGLEVFLFLVNCTRKQPRGRRNDYQEEVVEEWWLWCLKKGGMGGGALGWRMEMRAVKGLLGQWQRWWLPQEPSGQLGGVSARPTRPGPAQGTLLLPAGPSLADTIRSAICFPFVLVSIKNGSAWTYSVLSCKVVAFMAVLFCFHAAFMLFCISVTRYMAIAHHRFYSKRMTFWTCVAVVCMVWTLSVAMAFPPVFDVGTYKFIREEDQCIFEHRYFKANDTLGFMLMLAVLILATHVVYMKLLLFEYKHRKMKPVQMVPAISQNWTFHGPGRGYWPSGSQLDCGLWQGSDATHSAGNTAELAQPEPAPVGHGGIQSREAAW
ncbi:putative G-protein coupled receptor 173 [Larimichthys crocea]|uniref:Probable G-protein coupled receptor 173 n=1 Tax=Larimichthys crocea TaxID=215358 RepID=A0A6G0INA9_LARCR|nr:putative G-protein coupled receptor 173 [Larimichthys crocea]